jgi:putative ABC transport system permease protein
MIKIGAGLALVAVAVALSRIKRLGAERELVVATIRALVQLAAVTLLIDLVFSGLGYSTLLLGVMLAAAAFTSSRRMRGIPRAAGIASMAIGASTAVGLVLLFATRAFPFEPRYLIPIAGMLIGNAMNAVSIAGLRLKEEVVDKRAEIEARLALGASASYALNPYLRAAVRTALIPLVDSTKNVGLVALPGAFVGMMLGGATPREAATVQLVVLFMLLGTVSVAALSTATLVTRRLIAPGERLAI